MAFAEAAERDDELRFEAEADARDPEPEEREEDFAVVLERVGLVDFTLFLAAVFTLRLAVVCDLRLAAVFDLRLAAMVALRFVAVFALLFALAVVARLGLAVAFVCARDVLPLALRVELEPADREPVPARRADLVPLFEPDALRVPTFLPADGLEGRPAGCVRGAAGAPDSSPSSSSSEPMRFFATPIAVGIATPSAAPATTF